MQVNDCYARWKALRQLLDLDRDSSKPDGRTQTALAIRALRLRGVTVRVTTVSLKTLT
jgi:hypothetical protein